MRRKDREITDSDELRAILDKCEVCRLGLSVDGQAYIVPLNFGYEFVDGTLLLYFHGATVGRKIDMIKQNPKVCFEMDCDHKLIASSQACEFSYDFESLMGEGKIEFVTVHEEKLHGFDVLMKKWVPDTRFTFDEAAVARTCIMRCTATSFTGKRHRTI